MRDDMILGQLYAKVEDAILDLMDILDEIREAWARQGKGSFEKPDWEELRRIRKQLREARK